MQEKLDAQKIKQECDLAAVCEALGLKKIGTRTYQCPFPDNHAHGDANASLAVFPVTKGFKCFVPHKNVGGDKYASPFEWSGDIFKLVMDIKRIRFGEAVDFVRRVTETKKSDFSESFSKAVVASRAIDHSLWGPMLFKFLAGCKPAINYPEIVECFERISITPETLACAGVRYLDSPDDTLKKMSAKYSVADMTHCGLLYDDGTLKFQNHRIVVPFWVGTYITHIHALNFAWGETYETRDLRGEIYSIYNQEKLPALPPGTLVYICYGIIDVLSCYEILRSHPGAVVLGMFDNKFYPDWVPLFKDLRVQILFPMSRDDFAQSLGAAISGSAREVVIKNVPREYANLNDYLSGVKSGGGS